MERSAAESGQKVLYITERCVFRLKDEKLELIEVAPGIDIERNILPNMAFEPVIDTVATMDPRIFQARQMGIRPELLTIDIDERIQYSPEISTLRLNFKGLEIETADDIEIIRQVAEKKCSAPFPMPPGSMWKGPTITGLSFSPMKRGTKRY